MTDGERERELDERKGADPGAVGLRQFRMLRLIRAGAEAGRKATLRSLHPRVRFYDREPDSSTSVALTILVDRGLLSPDGPPRAQARTWSLTERGRAILEHCEQRTRPETGQWAYDHADRVAAGEHPPDEQQQAKTLTRSPKRRSRL